MKTPKRIIRKTKIPWMGKRGYAINPYTGCSHKCSWDNIKCWAWTYKSRRGEDFQPAPIPDFIERLEEELSKVPPSNVLISNLCDPYQPIEEKYKLTQEAVKLLIEHEWTPIILTKACLVSRDYYLFNKIGQDKIWVGMTLTSPRMDFTSSEGGDPFDKRVKTLRRYKGLKWISWEPMPPILSFATIDNVLKAVNPQYVVFGSLNHSGIPRYDYSNAIGKIMSIVDKYYPDIRFMIKKEIFFGIRNNLARQLVKKHNLLPLTSDAPWLKEDEKQFVYKELPTYLFSPPEQDLYKKENWLKPYL